MRHDRGTDRALDVLVRLAGPDGVRQAVRERIGVAERPSTVVPESRWDGLSQLSADALPVSARLWVLEEDRTDLNELLVLADGLPRGLESAVLHGEPFGPGRKESVPLAGTLRDRLLAESADRLPATELIPVLRAARTMRQGRRAARSTGRGDWPLVIEADTEQPLPGYTRWALALRPDCPPVLRERFSAHPGYAHRMRLAGIVDGPESYVRQWRSARTVLCALDTGRWAFPTREREAEEALRPLVRDSLGANVEAWAVLAQLLPTFTGTVPELIVTAGAIA
ncbi:hypothetical protein ACFYZN_00855 [Streptomyces sp. NPDC001777]|uniref:hypothetical protein n=1 Tax=Streptomyces sp. NPDC001777 TaxID=3364608 RepID=UPI0036936DE1